MTKNSNKNDKSNKAPKELPGKAVDPKVWSNTLPAWEKVKEWGRLSKSTSK